NTLLQRVCQGEAACSCWTCRFASRLLPVRRPIRDGTNENAGLQRAGSMRVLVIEDDRETAQFLQRSLRESGHTADVAGDGETGLSMARDDKYDVLIVDRMLPRRDGLSVVQTLRGEGARTPVLILSALGEVDDRVKGLRAGGDDYLTKPYAYSELLARIEALARRPAPEEQTTRYMVGDLSLDRLSHKVTRA